MNGLEAGKIWECSLFPKRSIRLIRIFFKNKGDRYFEFRPNGWMVQGITEGVDYGSEYEICEQDIIGNFILK